MFYVLVSILIILNMVLPGCDKDYGGVEFIITVDMNQRGGYLAWSEGLISTRGDIPCLLMSHMSFQTWCQVFISIVCIFSGGILSYMSVELPYGGKCGWALCEA